MRIISSTKSFISALFRKRKNHAMDAPDAVKTHVLCFGGVVRGCVAQWRSVRVSAALYRLDRVCDFASVAFVASISVSRDFSADISPDGSVRIPPRLVSRFHRRSGIRHRRSETPGKHRPSPPSSETFRTFLSKTARNHVGRSSS